MCVGSGCVSLDGVLERQALYFCRRSSAAVLTWALPAGRGLVSLPMCLVRVIADRPEGTRRPSRAGAGCTRQASCCARARVRPVLSPLSGGHRTCREGLAGLHHATSRRRDVRQRSVPRLRGRATRRRRNDVVAVSAAHGIACGYGLGAALLALWILFRYPRLGPNTLVSAVLTVGCAQLLLLLTGKATAATQGVAGPVVALVAVFLPLLVFPFWAAFRLIHVTNNCFKA